MNWNTVLGVMSTIAFLIPVAVILTRRLYKCTSLFILLVYYALQFTYNLMTQDLIKVSDGLKRTTGIVFNYFDAPLMLLVLLFFCNTPAKRKFLKITWAAIVLFEIITIVIKGITISSNVYILAIDLIIILTYSFAFFLTQIKLAFRNIKKMGRTLMTVAILFSYVTYCFIYLVYYVQRTNAVSDVYLLFFISSIVSCIIMAIGLIYVSKRLKDLEDLKVTRKELQLFFNS